MYMYVPVCTHVCVYMCNLPLQACAPPIHTPRGVQQPRAHVSLHAHTCPCMHTRVSPHAGAPTAMGVVPPPPKHPLGGLPWVPPQAIPPLHCMGAEGAPMGTNQRASAWGAPLAITHLPVSPPTGVWGDPLPALHGHPGVMGVTREELLVQIWVFLLDF